MRPLFSSLSGGSPVVPTSAGQFLLPFPGGSRYRFCNCSTVICTVVLIVPSPLPVTIPVVMLISCRAAVPIAVPHGRSVIVPVVVWGMVPSCRVIPGGYRSFMPVIWGLCANSHGSFGGHAVAHPSILSHCPALPVSYFLSLFHRAMRVRCCAGSPMPSMFLCRSVRAMCPSCPVLSCRSRVPRGQVLHGVCRGHFFLLCFPASPIIYIGGRCCRKCAGPVFAPPMPSPCYRPAPRLRYPASPGYTVCIFDLPCFPVRRSLWDRPLLHWGCSPVMRLQPCFGLDFAI